MVDAIRTLSNSMYERRSQIFKIDHNLSGGHVVIFLLVYTGTRLGFLEHELGTRIVYGDWIGLEFILASILLRRIINLRKGNLE